MGITACGFGGGAPNAAAIFQFFQKIKHFYAYFGINYCLETCFYMTA